MTPALKTPVAFVLFNRPKCTRRVFAEIRKARPENLYIIADGPRPHKQGESEKCAETRKLVEDMIDWPCQVRRDTSETNLGCRKRIVSGLHWVFEQEEEAIILEDDTLPDPNYFDFCSTMLEHYRDNDRILTVCGFNEIHHRAPSGDSCFFSTYNPIWGWATWRRAWKLYKSERPDLDAEKADLRQRSPNPQEIEQLYLCLKHVEAGTLDTWDFHWRAAFLVHCGLSVLPSRNLVRNIGFGADATHTISPFNPYRFKRSGALPPPYRIPAQIVPDTEYDQILHRKHRFARSIEPLRNMFLHMLSGKR